MIEYPTIVLEGDEIKLAEKKAQELVNFFMPRNEFLYLLRS